MGCECVLLFEIKLSNDQGGFIGADLTLTKNNSQSYLLNDDNDNNNYGDDELVSFTVSTGLLPPYEINNYDSGGKLVWWQEQSNDVISINIDGIQSNMNLITIVSLAIIPDNNICIVNGSTNNGIVIWSNVVNNCIIWNPISNNNNNIMQSEDGTTVAVLYISASLNESFCTKLLVIDSESGLILFNIVVSEYDPWPISLSMSVDGRWIMVTNGADYQPFTYVYDRSIQNLRCNAFIIGVSTVISSDGDWIAGSMDDTIYLNHFNSDGPTYSPYWSNTNSNYTVSQIAFAYSTNNSYLWITWNNNDLTGFSITLYDLFLGNLLWEWVSPITTIKGIENLLTDITILNEFVAITSWGNIDQSIPQSYIFKLNSSFPIFNYTSPGSMLNNDIYQNQITKQIYLLITGIQGKKYKYIKSKKK